MNKHIEKTEATVTKESLDPCEKGFRKFRLKPSILTSLKRMGYEQPSPIQEEAIPLIMRGNDIIGQAETGSGKTAACGIPILNDIDTEKIELQALVLVPTRELAVQYVEELAQISKSTGVRCFSIYGGSSISIQRAKLRHGVHMLVGTPGRLIDHLYSGNLILSSVTTFVVDEADEMLDLGFIKDVELLADCIIGEHQTLLFSATMPPPIRALAERYLNNPILVAIERPTATPKGLKHYYVPSEDVDKSRKLMELIRKPQVTQAIIFCKSRIRVSSLYDNLRRQIPNIDFMHGGLDQPVRLKIMERFKAGKLKFLIATDVAARGLDFSGVSHVINYDIPGNIDSYIHRTGRTARWGRKGKAVSLMSRREAEYLYNIQQRIKAPINRLGSEDSPVPKPSARTHTSQRKGHYRRPGQFHKKYKKQHGRAKTNEE